MIRNELYYQNRIELLQNRGTECARIIKKLERRKRALQK